VAHKSGSHPPGRATSRRDRARARRGLPAWDLRKLCDDVTEVLNALDGADTGIDLYLGYKSDLAEHRQYQDEVEPRCVPRRTPSTGTPTWPSLTEGPRQGQV